MRWTFLGLLVALMLLPGYNYLAGSDRQRNDSALEPPDSPKSVALEKWCREQGKRELLGLIRKAHFEDGRVISQAQILPGHRHLPSIPQPPFHVVYFGSKCKVTNRHLRTLVEEFPEISALGLGGCQQITDDGLEPIQQLSPDRLSLRGTSITNQGLKHLRGCNRLHSVDLGETRITAEGLKELELLPLLELRLAGSRVTDEGLDNLAPIVGLRQLDLSETGITDAGLKHLAGLTNLYWLKMDKADITGSGLVHLKGLPELSQLRLNGSAISDAGLKAVGELSHLTNLDLRETAITDAGLQHLHKLPELKVISLKGCKVTDAGVEALRRAIPKLVIRQGALSDFEP